MEHSYIDEHNVAEAYLVGTLPPDEGSSFAAHCTHCEECADRLELARLFLKHKAPYSSSLYPNEHSAHDTQPGTHYDDPHEFQDDTRHDLKHGATNDTEHQSQHEAPLDTPHDVALDTPHGLEHETIHHAEPKLQHDVAHDTAHDVAHDTAHEFQRNLQADAPHELQHGLEHDTRLETPPEATLDTQHDLHNDLSSDLPQGPQQDAHNHPEQHFEAHAETDAVPAPSDEEAAHEALHAVNGKSHSAKPTDFLEAEPEWVQAEWIRVTVGSSGTDTIHEYSARERKAYRAETVEDFAESFDEIPVSDGASGPPTMELMRVSQFRPWIIPTMASLATTLAVMMEVIRRQQIELARRAEQEPLTPTARFIMQFEPWQLVALGAIAGLLLLLMPATYFLWELTQLLGR